MASRGNVPAIGIDPGTTYSCVAVWQHDRIEIIAKMIEDAERFKFEDIEHMKKVTAHRALNDCVLKLREKIKDYKVRLGLRKKGLSVKDLEDLEHVIDETIEWLDENDVPEKDELEEKKSVLFNLCKQKKLHQVEKALFNSAFGYD